MANNDAAYGFLPIKGISSSNSALIRCRVVTPTSAIYKGDLVIHNGSADADGNPEVDIAGATGAVLGVVQAVDFDSADLDNRFLDTTESGYVLVNADPDQLYEVQSAGTVNATDIGLNANWSYAAGTSDGMSRSEISATMGTTATSQLKIIGAVDRADNELGSANAKVIVKINNHQLSGGTGTAGV